MSGELRACPFCGGKAEAIQHAPRRWTIQCENDDCAVSQEMGHFTEEEAAAAWNRRPAPSAIVSSEDMERTYPMPPGFDPATRTYIAPEYELADRIVRETEHLNDPREAIAALLRSTKPAVDVEGMAREIVEALINDDPPTNAKEVVAYIIHRYLEGR